MKPYPWHVAALERLLAQRDRLPHALLVHGPRGIGKTEFARALGASVLCESPVGNLACGHCVSCHWFSQGNHPDFREVVPEAASEDDDEEVEAAGAKAEKAKSLFIKIEQVRALSDFIALSTHRAGYRVLVMRPAETLHPNAANALLKTLEEPPPSTLIVMVSERPARVLPTIRSRCRSLGLGLPPASDALAWLRGEGVGAPEIALATAGGAPLLARELAEASETEFRTRILGELSRPGGANALAYAGSVDRAKLERFLYWMQTWVFDVVSRKAGAPIRHHPDLASAIEARAKAAGLDALFDLERELAEARRLVSHPLNPRLLVEHLLLTYNRAVVQ
jgi:DNA polymerase III subunit delta'